LSRKHDILAIWIKIGDGLMKYETTGEVFKSGRITLINDDCMNILKQTPDNYYHLSCVDPPFGLGEKLTSGGTWAGKYTSSDSAWDIAPGKPYFDELRRAAENWIVWGGNNFTQFLPPARCFLIWDKVAKMQTMADSELALTSFDKNAKTFSHVRNTSERRIHLCQKPVKLYEWLLTNYANKGDRILDTHLGSGSSAIAAHNLGFDFTGVELDQDYFKAAIARLENHQKQPTLFSPPLTKPEPEQGALL